MTDSQSRPLNDEKDVDGSCEMTQNLNPQTWKVIFDNLANGRQEKTRFMDSTSTSHSYIEMVEERKAALLSDSMKSSGSSKPNQDVMKQLNEILKKNPTIGGKVSRYMHMCEALLKLEWLSVTKYVDVEKTIFAVFNTPYLTMF